MQAAIYEDGSVATLEPLTLLRPVFDLRCGALKLREKLELRRPEWPVSLVPRPELASLVGAREPDRGPDSLGDGRTLFISASVIVDDSLLDSVEAIPDDRLLTHEGRVVGCLVSSGAGRLAADLASGRADLGSLGLEEKSDLPLNVVSWPWDLVDATYGEIAKDAPLVPGHGERRGTMHEGAILVSPEGVTTGTGSTLEPGVVVDATGGEVLIGREVRVMANSCIRGPACIGDGSLVRAGTRIYGGTSIGPVCKVGGEVSAAVIQSHSNKQHGGYLGRSYLGSWVNLGAGTDTSDLRNDYGPVRVTIRGESVVTGRLSVGSIIGDHTKTAIGTKLNTG
ncbi:MAG: hypothetical protein GF400_00665, partial [Candidatus Eisenbacteria bacterium]|nr:hypothetical protein [Candidatus Eisenbacteria bacterium]